MQEQHDREQDVCEKLAGIKAQVREEELRQVKCPICGYCILLTYGYDHFFYKAKCRKCKFEDVIDAALFRKAGNRRKRLRLYHSELRKPLR